MTTKKKTDKKDEKKERIAALGDYEHNLWLFSRLLHRTLRQMGGWRKSMDDYTAFIDKLCGHCQREGMAEEEALAIAEGELDKRLTDEQMQLMQNRFRLIYNEEANSNRTPEQQKIISKTAQMEACLNRHHRFRYNEMSGFTEYARSTTHPKPVWKPVDERALNSLVLDLHHEGIDVWNVDVLRYLRSERVPKYNALSEFADQIDHTEWDGRDRISELADTVPCRDKELWRQWLGRWLMGMYMQWRPYLDDRPFGNAVVPLLVGPQGWGKSRFCRRLLPAELQCGYTDSLLLTNKRDVLTAMSQMLLINLDEFNQYSPQTQSGFLKNVVQLSSVKVKPPYGTRQVEMPRLASFIATSNQTDILTDPSGSRRFVVIELTAAIDDTYELDHLQLFAQVAHLIHDLGQAWWFTPEETDAIIAHNRPYQLQQPVDQLFEMAFRPPQSLKEGQWLSAAEIYERLRTNRTTAPLLRNVNLITFGRRLSANTTLPRRRIGQIGNQYLVVLKD